MKTFDADDKAMVAAFEQRLVAREAESRLALHASDQLINEGEAQAHDTHDFKDMATLDALTEVSEVAVERAAQQLSQVLAAKRRLADGSYGACMACGNTIDLRRLQLLPEASNCTSCQSKRERERPGAALG